MAAEKEIRAAEAEEGRPGEEAPLDKELVYSHDEREKTLNHQLFLSPRENGAGEQEEGRTEREGGREGGRCPLLQAMASSPFPIPSPLPPYLALVGRNAIGPSLGRTNGGTSP